MLSHRGEQPVREVLKRVVKHLETGTLKVAHRPAVEVPEGLREYMIEAAHAADYDALLVGAER